MVIDERVCWVTPRKLMPIKWMNISDYAIAYYKKRNDIESDGYCWYNDTNNLAQATAYYFYDAAGYEYSDEELKGFLGRCGKSLEGLEIRRRDNDDMEDGYWGWRFAYILGKKLESMRDINSRWVMVDDCGCEMD